MTITIFLLLVLAVVASALLVVAVADRVWARRLHVHRRVVVNLDTGRAVTGVLWTRRGGMVVMKQAELLEQGAVPVAADGDVVIDARRVEFIQVTG